MERLSLVKAADTDRGARQRLAGLESTMAALKEQQASAGAAPVCGEGAVCAGGRQRSTAARATLPLTLAPARLLSSSRLPAPQQAELSAMWEAERDEMGKVQALKGEIDRVNIEIQVGLGWV